MIAYIYKSRRKDELYLYIAKKDDFSDVPQALYDSMGKEPVFVMEVKLSPDRKLARENVETVMKNLAEKGFHLQIPPPALNITSFKEPAKYVS
ncbi:MAG: YcgL domain-containing protein [Methylophaga sp.]|nr:YcgL domain-containing protein [Methylophaga sp.]